MGILENRTTLNASVREWLTPRSRFARNAFIIVSGTMAGHVVSALVTPALSRIYSPEQFGAFAVFTSLFSVLSLGSFRYEYGISAASDRKEAISLASLSLLLLTASSAIVGLAVLGFGEKTAAMLGIPELAGVMWMLPLSMLSLGIFQVLTFWLIREQKYLPFVRIKVVSTVSSFLMQLGLGLGGALASGLVAGDLFGRMCGAVILVGFLLSGAPELWSASGLTELGRVMWKHRRYPQVSVVSALFNVGGQQLPPVLFAAYYGAQTAGWFAFTLRFSLLLSSVVGQSIAQAFTGEITQLANSDPAQLYELFRNTTIRLIWAGGALALIFASCGGFLFPLVFGPNWAVSGRYAQLLAPMILVDFVVTPLSQVLLLLHKQMVQLFWAAGRLAMIVAGLWLCSTLGWSAERAVGIYGAIMMATYVLFFFLARAAIQERIDRCSPA